jgi:hypothetical protein
MSIAAVGSGQCNNRTDDRSRREPMKVAWQYEKLNGERNQRAPRSKSNLRPNPPHRGLNPSPIPRAVTAGPRKPAQAKLRQRAISTRCGWRNGAIDTSTMPLLVNRVSTRDRSGDHYSITSLARPGSGSGISDSERLGGFEVDDQFASAVETWIFLRCMQTRPHAVTTMSRSWRG